MNAHQRRKARRARVRHFARYLRAALQHITRPVRYTHDDVLDYETYCARLIREWRGRNTYTLTRS